jgi:rhodanese-related sulfurtransferase
MIRNKLWILLVCLIFAPGLLAWEYIPSDSLKSLITRSAVPFLLDVREHDEYLARHIPGVALYSFDSAVLENKYLNLPSDRPLVVICSDGDRSVPAAAFLESRQDIALSDIFVLEGGMSLWNYEVIIDDQHSFSQEQVLCEMFTSSSCDLCFFANHYLDTEIMRSIYFSKLISLPRYRLLYPEPLPDVGGRDKYYGYVPIPTIVINGRDLIDPLELTLENINDYLDDSTQIGMGIYGSVTSSGSHVVDLRVELEAGPAVEAMDYNLFILITQDSLNPDLWDPPFYPLNGETMFNGSVRNCVESDTGSTFTIQPGESRFFDRTFVLDNSYSIPECSVIAFVQNLETRSVYQVDSRALSQLAPFNSAPKIMSLEARDCFVILTGDTLSVEMAMQDPDQNDKVTPTISSWFSSDSVTFAPYSSPEIYLDDSTFVFTTGETQAGNYRFDIVLTDRWALSDTLSLHVLVSETVKCCDFSGDSVVDFLDVISFLLMMRNDPQNPRLDWNRDGNNNIIDALGLLLDIRAGKCPTPQGAGSLLASADGTGYYYSIVPGSLDSDDIEWLKTAIAAMDIDSQQRDELISMFSTVRGPALLPGAFSLAQNSPNPFNPSTTIRYNVPESCSEVSLRVYDLRGRLVRVLIDGKREGGEHTVFFDGRYNSGRQLPSGVYLYRLVSGEFSSTRKMLLLK